MKKVILSAMAIITLSGCFCVPSGEPPEGNTVNPASESVVFNSLNEIMQYWINTLPGVLAVKVGFGTKVTVQCNQSLREGIEIERKIIEDAVITNGGEVVPDSRYKILSVRKKENWKMSLYDGNAELWTRLLVVKAVETNGNQP